MKSSVGVRMIVHPAPAFVLATCDKAGRANTMSIAGWIQDFDPQSSVLVDFHQSAVVGENERSRLTHFSKIKGRIKVCVLLDCTSDLAAY
ncbi:MAG TPA: hypothetical protein PKH03_01950 [Syntrophales bacterium]|nr:hypothetical protein [Syntrophales bacterium]